MFLIWLLSFLRKGFSFFQQALNRAGYSSSLHFDRSGNGRFDGPDQSYGLLYVGDQYSSFIECFGRTFDGAVTVTALRNRNLFKIKSDRPLVLADLTGPGLVRMGIDARISSGDYEYCRIWGQHIWKHPQAVDGIRYRSRHDDSVYSIGLFDRVRDHLTEENLGNLFDKNIPLLDKILEHYVYDLIVD
ncbi:MAG: RES family NAD+ phosphorylase [Snowella sp.]|nr:RES family NAD+ phosphorylase [Snowella sp.]